MALLVTDQIDRSTALQFHFAAEPSQTVSNLLIVEKDARHAPVLFGRQSREAGNIGALASSLQFPKMFGIAAQGVLSTHYPQDLYDFLTAPPSDRDAPTGPYTVQVAAKSEHWHKAVQDWAKTQDPAVEIKANPLKDFPGVVNYVFTDRNVLEDFCAQLDQKAFDFAAKEIEALERGVVLEQYHQNSWPVQSPEAK